VKRFKEFLFVASATAIFVDAPAYAYLDGGTISLFLQGVTGAVAAGLLFGRTYLAKLTSMFRRPSDAGPNDNA